MLRRILLLTALLVGCAVSTLGQQGNVIGLQGAGAPAGTCATGIMTYIDTSSSNFYICPNGAWLLLTSASFSGITIGDWTGAVVNDVACMNASDQLVPCTPITVVSFEAACQNTTASLSLDTPTANAPAAACVTGSNIVNRGVMDFDPATDETVYASFTLPSSWAGTIDLAVEASANEASTNVAVLQIATICVGAGETYDPAFNAAQSFNWTGTGTANQKVIATQTAVTTTTCTGGERLFFKFNRDANSGSDTLAVDLRVISIRFLIKG